MPDAGGDAGADVGGQMPIELQVGLVGHWPFDEATGTSTPDRSGGNNGATLLMSPTFVTGRIGAGALDMSGDLDLAEVRDPPDGRLDFDNGDFTVSVWVKTTQMPMGAPDIVVKWPSNLNTTGPRSGWALTLPQGTVLWKGQTDNGPQMGVPGPAINDGAWHHLAGRKTAGELALFVDGRLQGTRPHTLGNISNTAPVWIAGFGSNSELNFDGQVDELRIYNRALGAGEIRALASVPAP
jgi:sialidase-1